MDEAVSPANSSLVDPPGNVVLNFLKWHHACRASRHWVLQKYNEANAIEAFDKAWSVCNEPFWMLWALDRAGAVPSSGGSGGQNARARAMTAVNTVVTSNLNSYPVALAALKTLTNYITPPVGGPPTAAQFAADRYNARQLSASLAVSAPPGGDIPLGPVSRSAAALAAAFDCADGDNIDAADRAWSLATEAIRWDTTNKKVDLVKWSEDRKALATGDIFNLFDPTSAAGKAIIDALTKQYSSPPPWSKNTNHQRKLSKSVEGKPIGVPTASTPPGNWIATTTKSGTAAWQAFGTDDDPPTGRSAWVTDVNNNQLAGGTYISPPSNNPLNYTWGFQFTGLTVGQTVTLNVQWDYQKAPSNTQNVTCVVAGTS
jgi:hypothetical protein